MDTYKNKHLLEVACTFNYELSEDDWDSSYFGVFYEKIKTKGFTEKEERKGIQIKFNGSDKGLQNTSLKEVEPKMIFRNKTDGYAIVFGPNSISFNKLGNYTDWETFKNSFLIEFFKIFQELGLDIVIQNAQITYLNKFLIDSNNELSDYFKLISKINSFGVEQNCTIQRSFIVDDKISLFGKLNYKCNENVQKEVYLECGSKSLTPLTLEHSTDLINLATITKQPVRDFFDQIITDKLKSTL